MPWVVWLILCWNPMSIAATMAPSDPAPESVTSMTSGPLPKPASPTTDTDYVEDYSIALVSLYAHFDGKNSTENKLEISVNPKGRAVVVSIFQDNLTVTNQTSLSRDIISRASAKSQSVGHIQDDQYPWVFPLGQIDADKVNRILEEFVVIHSSLKDWNRGKINDSKLMSEMSGTLIGLSAGKQPPKFLRTWKHTSHIRYDGHGVGHETASKIEIGIGEGTEGTLQLDPRLVTTIWLLPNNAGSTPPIVLFLPSWNMVYNEVPKIDGESCVRVNMPFALPHLSNFYRPSSIRPQSAENRGFKMRSHSGSNSIKPKNLKNRTSNNTSKNQSLTINQTSNNNSDTNSGTNVLYLTADNSSSIVQFL